jgi:hypothetical protein
VRPDPRDDIRASIAALERVVAPALTDEYASLVLNAVIGTLADLDRKWPTSLVKLREESGKLQTLFGAIVDQLPAAVADSVRALNAGTDPDWLDFDAACEHYRQGRELLAQAIRLGLVGQTRALVLEYLRDEIAQSH